MVTGVGGLVVLAFLASWSLGPAKRPAVQEKEKKSELCRVPTSALTRLQSQLQIKLQKPF
jgi:hypothetical protein